MAVNLSSQAGAATQVRAGMRASSHAVSPSDAMVQGSIPPPSSIEDVRAAVAQSRDLILSLQAPSGAYRAAIGFGPYEGFCWLRDGAFTADAMSLAGEVQSATRYFDWCARAILAVEEDIESISVEAAMGQWRDGRDMLPGRFTLEGDWERDDWGNFQIDGYGTWLWALGEHCRRHDISPERWTPAIALTVAYLRATWQRPCFDWWEERPDARHTSTLMAVAAGLRAAAWMMPAMGLDAESAADEVLETIFQRSLSAGHLTKTLEVDDQAVDASLAAGISPFCVIAPDSPIACATLGAIERDLTDRAGIHRYAEDRYYGGGRWPLLSCLMGLADIEMGNPVRAHRLFDWAVSTRDEEGRIPEQVVDTLLFPDDLDEWVGRNGLPARPLLWSHAMVVRLGLALVADSGIDEDGGRA